MSDCEKIGLLLCDIIGEGYHSFEWEHNPDTDAIILKCYSKEVRGMCVLNCLEDMYDNIRNEEAPL